MLYSTIVLTVFRVYALWPKMHTFAVIIFLVGMVNPCLTIVSDACIQYLYSGTITNVH